MIFVAPGLVFFLFYCCVVRLILCSCRILSEWMHFPQAAELPRLSSYSFNIICITVIYMCFQFINTSFQENMAHRPILRSEFDPFFHSRHSVRWIPWPAFRFYGWFEHSGHTIISPGCFLLLVSLPLFVTTVYIFLDATLWSIMNAISSPIFYCN